MKQNEDTNGDIGHQNGPPGNLLRGIVNSSGDPAPDTTDTTNASNVEGQRSEAMEPEDVGCKYVSTEEDGRKITQT